MNSESMRVRAEVATGEVRGFFVGVIVGLFLAALVFTACGCVNQEEYTGDYGCSPNPDPDEEMAVLMEAAEAELGPIPPECMEYHEVVWVTSRDEFPDTCGETCGRDCRLVGCSAYRRYGDVRFGPHIWVLDCQPEPGVTIRHERLHTLLICMGMPDSDHATSIWDRLGVR